MEHWNLSSGCFVFCIRQYRIKEDNVQKEAGGRLNKKDGLTRYGDSHVKDKTS